MVKFDFSTVKQTHLIMACFDNLYKISVNQPSILFKLAVNGIYMYTVGQKRHHFSF